MAKQPKKLTLKKYVIQPFDNLFHPLGRGEQQVLGAVIDCVRKNSDFGDSSFVVKWGNLLPYFNCYGVGVEYADEAMVRLHNMGYICRGCSEYPDSIVITNKGWMGWKHWNPEFLADVAVSYANSTWDWDSILPICCTPDEAKDLREMVVQFRRETRQVLA